MPKDYEKYKDRHQAFWSLQNIKSPLVGFTIGAGLDSWSYWHYNKAAQALLSSDEILAEDIHPIDFVEDQLRYLELSNQVKDDICRSAMPLASIPWMEAILGCQILSTKTSIKSKEYNDNIGSLKLVPFSDDNLWIKKYFEFIDIYQRTLSGKYPVSQSILRGPSDLACALIGIESASLGLLENPDIMQKILNYVTEQLAHFLQMQIKMLPKFQDGYVIGQYEIWAPEPPIRIQEDFSMLYSPELYKNFLQPLDTYLANISKYTLIHLHSSSLHLIDQFLDISQIRAFQITKDPNVVSLNIMLPALHKIQEAGKPLILKGQFNKEDFDQIQHQLSFRGLSLQPVVTSFTEAKKILPRLRNW